MQTDESPKQSSESSTHHSITDVKEILKKQTKKQLVDLIEVLMQYNKEGDKEETCEQCEYVQAAVEALYQLPHTKESVDTLPIGQMTFLDVEKYFQLERQVPLSGTSWEEPLPHIELPQCAYQMLEIIDRSARRCVQNEALIRYSVNNILFAVLDTVTMSALDDAQPLNPSDPSPFYSLFASNPSFLILGHHGYLHRIAPTPCTGRPRPSAG
ncbi:hypothetical protein N7489_009904 [Penicillium chrysogenum]|uniref:Uncharacterized protein n=1 Tax=Penicillium chrysogenum TaxID=5076 RepID=A0ABQ8WVB4_PENCH|nr:uncharacterized protein N7489_009904 [Penicillium chrysogenum]KAJ5229196.1 hypothetical protein N7489_009904 [Penicillium chrysogenum]KAJ5258596.1 hypothetical protein N7524_010152 [Penicillium chrysogenum]KAJ5282924.1 hypothetical protein N7505_000904 [Penicillium chrysogenum]KAJ6169072.1 hypothetical protein N7497_001915 [Penicillium chrysogenum]